MIAFPCLFKLYNIISQYNLVESEGWSINGCGEILNISIFYSTKEDIIAYSIIQYSGDKILVLFAVKLQMRILFTP